MVAERMLLALVLFDQGCIAFFQSTGFFAIYASLTGLPDSDSVLGLLV